MFIIAYLANGQTRNYVAMVPEHYKTRADAQKVAEQMGDGPIGQRKVVECKLNQYGYLPVNGDWPFTGNEDG